MKCPSGWPELLLRRSTATVRNPDTTSETYGGPTGEFSRKKLDRPWSVPQQLITRNVRGLTLASATLMDPGKDTSPAPAREDLDGGGSLVGHLFHLAHHGRLTVTPTRTQQDAEGPTEG